MKLILNRQQILSAVSPLMIAASGKSTLSAIDGILIEAKHPDTCTFTAYDHEKGVRTTIETKVVDEPWISFNDIADAKLTEADFGFKTGVVAKVTVGSDTNRTITVGNVVKGGSDRYMKIAGKDWTYIVPSYSVDKFLPKPPPEPKKEEPKKSEG